MKKFNKKSERAEQQYAPRLVGEILHNYFENSNEPMAVAYRERLHPNTELCVDIKLLTQKRGPMEDGEEIIGVIKRDSEMHFTFTEVQPKQFTEYSQLKSNNYEKD